MADQDEPKARYPKQEVADGQKAGYIGDVETYTPAHTVPGHSNSTATAKDSQPEEKPIVGSTGVIGGTVDNVKAPKP